ncbi:MAG: ABC transporter ATP-binding protein [Thermoplasmata archaeon]
MVTVEVNHLNKNFGKLRVLNDINLKINNGELFVVIGPSGSGKSTLLRIIAGLESPDSGNVLFDGVDVTTIPPNKRGIGMVFQDYAIWPHMNVEQNIKFVIKNKKPEEEEEILKDVLETVGLLSKRKNRPSELSGGELQRVAIARALAVKPRLFLMDEPLSNLDEKIRKELLVEILDIVKENNLTTLFVTHSQEEAFEIGDKIAVINKGVIEQMGMSDELINTPYSSFVAKFIGDNLVLDGKLIDMKGDVATIELNNLGIVKVIPKNRPDLNEGESILLIVRMNDLKISDENPNNSFKVKIISKKIIKDKVKAYFETPNLIRIGLEINSSWKGKNGEWAFLEIPDYKSFIFKK